MIYERHHYECANGTCKTYSAYIKIRNKWIHIGKYHTECKTFTAIGKQENTKAINQQLEKTPIEPFFFYDNQVEIQQKPQKERQDYKQLLSDEDLFMLINSLS